MIKILFGKLVQVSEGVCSRWRNLFYSALGMNIKEYVWLRKIHIPRQWSDITLHPGVALDEGVSLIPSGSPNIQKICIGRATYINRNTIIDASLSICIGSQTMIGPNCYITDHDHHYLPGTPPGEGKLLESPTSIGERVWLGAGVTVLKGVSIGDDSIIGAGSVVTKHIPANCLALGLPAKVIRSL